MLYLWVVGFVTLLGQAVLLRELNVAFYGVELIYLLSLGVWILWGALGVMLSRRRTAHGPGLIRALLVLYSLLLPLDLAFVRGIRVLFSDVPGAYLSFPLQALALSLALMPIGLLSGLLFQKAAVYRIRRGSTLALAYAVESAGALAGGLCATLLLRWGVQNFTASLLCSLAASSAAGIGPFRGRQRPLPGIAAASTALLVLAMFNGASLDRFMTSWTHPELVETRDSPYGRVTLTRSGGQLSVFENDALSFETEGTLAEELAHSAALQHPSPGPVLLLGGSVDGTAREILRHQPERVDCVEMNRVLVEAVIPRLYGGRAEWLQSPNLDLLFRDPRHFLRSAGSYDLILVAMPDPASGQSNRFYTEDFFRQCARRLTGNGVLAFRAASSENLWTPQLRRRNGSIYRALQAAFPDIVVLPGVSNIFLASRGKLSRDPDELAGRLEARGIKARLMSRPYIRYLYTNDRFQQVRQSLEGSAAPVNTDERPICYQLTVVLWLSKFFPGLALVDLDRITSLNILGFRTLWLPLSALLVLLSLAGRRPGCRRVVLAGMAGFMGMVLETILILQYQAGNGALYQDIGILLMSFMAGLSLGAWIVDRLPETWRRQRRVGLALIVGFALASAAIGRGIETGWLDTLAENGLFLVFSGALVSGLFAYAGTHGVEDSKSVLAPLYSADLVGGCIGAIGGSLVLVPLAGLSAAALLMVPVSLTCLALLAPR